MDVDLLHPLLIRLNARLDRPSGDIKVKGWLRLVPGLGFFRQKKPNLR